MEHYTIVLEIDPVVGSIQADVYLRATTTAALRAFNLDFVGLEIDRVEVNGSPAAYTRKNRELTVVPDQPLQTGAQFSVRITYHGTPDPVGSFLVPFDTGWFHTKQGTVNVMNIPDGAESWFPANDHQSDKATFRFEVTVPAPWLVVAPGSLLESAEQDGRKRYIYEMNTPMSTQSAVLHIDNYQVETMSAANGVPLAIYFPPDTPQDIRNRFAALPDMMAFLSDTFGPFPFGQYSIVIADPSISICAGNGLSASQQTLTLQCPSPFMTEELTTLHELVHQWFGVSVTTASLQDSWLDEGPATYSEWLWLTRDGGLAEIDELARTYEGEYSPRNKIGKPPFDNLVPQEVYVGGALLLHALRLRLGDEAFFETLRTYLDRYHHELGGTDAFIAVAQEVSGEDLRPFFDAWLLQVDPPTLPSLPG